MYNETHKIVTQQQQLSALGYTNLVQTEETIRIHVGAVEMADLEELERRGFRVLFIAADFPSGMFIAVRKD